MGRSSVYSCMTNGGIIEGNTEYSGFSDLSPATYFGSGETRMQMREALWGIKGPLKVLRHPAPNIFMKHLAMLIVGASASYGQQFNGTVVDLDSGRIQVINGEVEQPYQPYQPQIDIYRRIAEEAQASIDRMRAESGARAQLRELREQTELLRKIANE